MPVTGTDSRLVEDVQRVAINATLDGDNVIVAAQGAGKKIKVLALGATATAAGELLIQSANNTIGRLQLAANGGIVLPPVPQGGIPWFETIANEALVFENAVGQDIKGFLLYIVEE